MTVISLVLAELAWFRRGFYGRLTSRGDALFGLVDTALCTDGPVHSLAGLPLVAVHRHGHNALGQGRVELARLPRALTSVPLPQAADGCIVLAADVTRWLRPEAHTSPKRILCHTLGVRAA